MVKEGLLIDKPARAAAEARGRTDSVFSGGVDTGRWTHPLHEGEDRGHGRHRLGHRRGRCTWKSSARRCRRTVPKAPACATRAHEVAFDAAGSGSSGPAPRQVMPLLWSAVHARPRVLQGSFSPAVSGIPLAAPAYNSYSDLAGQARESVKPLLFKL